jgi:hypothetical protein
MKVQDAIDQLKEMYALNDDIIIAWWDYEFVKETNPKLTEEIWEDITGFSEYKMDWSHINEDIDWYIWDKIEDAKIDSDRNKLRAKYSKEDSDE